MGPPVHAWAAGGGTREPPPMPAAGAHLPPADVAELGHDDGSHGWSFPELGSPRSQPNTGCLLLEMRRRYPGPAVARRGPGADGSPPPTHTITGTPSTSVPLNPILLPTLWFAGMVNWHHSGPAGSRNACGGCGARARGSRRRQGACWGEAHFCQVWAAILLLLHMVMLLQGEKCWWDCDASLGQQRQAARPPARPPPAVQISNQPLAWGDLCHAMCCSAW